MHRFFAPSLLFSFAAALPALAQDRLPHVDLFTVDGGKVDLASYGENGKITVLNFWATWCTPCKKELNNITELYGDWVETYDMELVAISIDDAKTSANVRSYVAGQDWPYDVLLDANGVLKRRLNFNTIPFTVIVDREGFITGRHTGYVDGDEYLLEMEIADLAGE